ncbi:MAG: YIEGIA family protein [Firmicutes bacterium]|nr:YIEGIA family protein [Bacillota bacterium]
MEFWAAVVTGVVLGTLARLAMLRTDYRQYPSYPHGFASHLALGVVAAFTGAVVVPALVEKELTAATFLLLVAQQFREVRDLERKTLERMEETELVRRGAGYIEDIAKVFEARNYLTIFAALVASTATYLLWRPAAAAGAALVAPLAGAAGAVAVIAVGRRGLDRLPLGAICRVRLGKLCFRDTLLFVDDIQIKEIGLVEARRDYERHGIGIVLEPKDDNARATLANLGQRQAIAHDAAAILGVRKDRDTPEYTPIVRLDLDTGRAALAIIPIEPDPGPLLRAVSRVPVIEGARSRPLSTRAGRRAAD